MSSPSLLQQRRDDIRQLRTYLNVPGLSYQAITRQQELARIAERWPLIAETQPLLTPDSEETQPPHDTETATP